MKMYIALSFHLNRKILHLYPHLLALVLTPIPLTWQQHDNQFSSVQSRPTLCDPMNRSTPGLPVHHQLPEFTQTHVHPVSDANIFMEFQIPSDTFQLKADQRQWLRGRRGQGRSEISPTLVGFRCHIPHHCVVKTSSSRDFPGGQVVKTLCFHCREWGFDLWLGN